MQETQSNIQVRQHVAPQIKSHLPNSFEEWIRSGDIARRKLAEERVYQITQCRVDDPTARPEVVAFTSKASAQRLIAALALQEASAYRYRVTAFIHPVLPGFGGVER